MERALLHEAEHATRTAPMMLDAGAAVLVNAQQTEARAVIKRNTGFVESIGVYKRDIGGTNASIIVAPTGTANHGNASTGTKKTPGVKRVNKNPKPVRNAEIGFLLEYGAPGRGIQARNWTTRANVKSEDAVNQAMREVWDNEKDGS